MNRDERNRRAREDTARYHATASPRPRTERAKLNRLDAVLADLEAREVRALADLRTAGFAFTTIAAARQHQLARRTVANMTDAERDDVLIRALTERGIRAK